MNCVNLANITPQSRFNNKLNTNTRMKQRAIYQSKKMFKVDGFCTHEF